MDSVYRQGLVDGAGNNPPDHNPESMIQLCHLRDVMVIACKQMSIMAEMEVLISDDRHHFYIRTYFFFMLIRTAIV